MQRIWWRGAMKEIERRISRPRRFEWDEAKRQANAAKHGIDFADAAEIFDDQKRYIYRSSPRPDEERYVCVGMMRNILAAMVFTLRDEKIRIISVRAARRAEREVYG
jgi:uncharacterized DUF497 family protein